MPKYDNQSLLSAWLDYQLTDEQRTEFEQRCVDDKAFAQQVETANQFAAQADDYQQEAVPEWSRTGVFEPAVNTPRWWHWSGLSVVSMAMSVVAIVMVVSGAQFRFDHGSMTLSFQQANNQAELEKLVDARVAELQGQQSELMNEFASLMQQQQMQSTTQLTEYLLTSSRQERREDFAELIRFINQQRTDDQQFYARQLNKLQQQIYAEDSDIAWPANQPIQE